MAATNAKTIILIGRGIRKERVADGAITPGHLVYLKSTDKVGVHATAGGNAQKAFAIEDDLQGKTISDAYADASRVQYEIMERGAEINALIANGQDIAIGDPLESAGDGTLQKHIPDVESVDDDSSGNVITVFSDAIVAYAIEACDMSDSSAADPSGRCAVEIA